MSARLPRRERAFCFRGEVCRGAALGAALLVCDVTAVTAFRGHACKIDPYARFLPQGRPLSPAQSHKTRGFFVLASPRYRLAMPDDNKLAPATRHDVETCLSLGLTSGRRLARNQAAEVTA
jgi:hypothetical protein